MKTIAFNFKQPVLLRHFGPEEQPKGNSRRFPYPCGETISPFSTIRLVFGACGATPVNPAMNNTGRRTAAK